MRSGKRELWGIEAWWLHPKHLRGAAGIVRALRRNDTYRRREYVFVHESHLLLSLPAQTSENPSDYNNKFMADKDIYAERLGRHATEAQRMDEQYRIITG